VTGASAGHRLDVPITGVKILRLEVTSGGDSRDYDHADWGDARLTRDS
jgi:hypothetical protein